MDQPRGQFLAETEDLIEQIFVDLDGLRENKETGLQRKLVDRIFRRLHRIKGSAATFGLDGLSEIAHEFESLLSSRRAGTVVAGTGLQERQNSRMGRWRWCWILRDGLAPQTWMNADFTDPK